MFKLFKYLLYRVRILLLSIEVGFYFVLFLHTLLKPPLSQPFSCCANKLPISGRSPNLNTSTSASVVQQVYQSEVNNEYVILGNAAVLKCSIPSFVADFVSVISWQDDQGDSFANDISSSQYGIGKLQRITRIPDKCLLLIGFSTTLVYLITQK